METLTLILLIISLILHLGIGGAVAYLLFKPQPNPTAEIEAALSQSWIKLGLAEKMGQLSSHAQDIRQDYRALDQMLRVPTARGALGELALELILQDQLPPSMFGLRQRLPNGLIPDAYIRSTVGLICIDSKFGLDNYRQMMAADNARARESFKRQFLQNMQGHLDKIARDYVRPDDGTAAFAFAYIPAEGVYWFLATEAIEMMREYTKRGVQIVSPLTLSHKIELIRAGVFDRKLAEEAKQIKAELTRLGREFDTLDEEWRIFRQTHLGNLSRKAQAIDDAYQKLQNDFEKIADNK